jgi:hypothetical protein
MSFHFKLFFALAGIAVSAGCYSSSAKQAPINRLASAAEGKASQQLIIKFKPSSIVCSEREIAKFASEVHERVEFVRLMSGNACVIVHQAASVSALTQGQQKLKQHPSVEWLEADEAMQIH